MTGDARRTLGLKSPAPGTSGNLSPQDRADALVGLIAESVNELRGLVDELSGSSRASEPPTQ